VNVKSLAVRPARLGAKAFGGKAWKIPRLPPDAAWRLAVPLLLPFAVLTLWQITAARGWLSPQTLPAPAVVLSTLTDLVRDGEIARNLQISLRRILVGLVIGTSLGLFFGALLGVSRRLNDYFGPIITALSQIPSLGWVPILILIFGLDEMVKYLIIAKACFVPTVLATSQGIRNIPRAYIEVGQVLGLRRRTTLTKLIVPAALPTIFGGIRLALSNAWIALIVVEMFAATEGVGYMMVWGRTLFQVDIVIAGMVVIGVIGLAMDSGLARVERMMRRWEPKNV
jgi:sulfonate transport system permease protein